MPLKILIIHNYYRQRGGEHAAVEAQASLLRSNGHEVTLYTRDSREIDSYRLLQKIQLIPLTISSPKTDREIQDLIKSKRPDIAHVHNVFPLISPRIYQTLNEAGLPVVQTIHNFRFMCPNALFYTHGHVCERCKHGNMLHAIRLKCYRESYGLSTLYAFTVSLHRTLGTLETIDQFISLTEFSAQKLLESNIATTDRISVLGNFLPAPLPAAGGLKTSPPYFIYIGRLSIEKGVDVLLSALLNLAHLKVKILGDGPQAEVLQAFARQHKLSRVEFLGYVEGRQKWRLLKGATALILPSICYENFPLAALESLAVGTPVIASNIGSMPYVINESNGILFQPGSSQDLTEKLIWLSTHLDVVPRMGENGRRIVEEKYSSRVHYEQLMKIYAKVLA